MAEAVKHLVLVGGGHSHLFVLEAFARRPQPGVRLSLVAPGPLSTYSGMIPGVIGGQYGLREAQIDVARLAARAGAAFVAARVSDIRPDDRRLELSDGGAVDYDLVSFDIGSINPPPRRTDDAVALLAVKPIDALARALEATLQGAMPCRLAVVGAGAGGAEVALALAKRLRRGGAVSLCDRATRPLPSAGRRTSDLLAAALSRAGIAFAGGAEVATLDAAGLRFADGGRLPADLVVWATGASGHPLFAAAGLPVDERGFLRVGVDLRVEGRPEIFAAGDCATISAHPDLPKSGVYAVRQGPLLARNLRAALLGARTIPFHPRRRVLALLNTADQRAILSYGEFATHGRAAWWLKDWIDRRFVQRFDRNA